MIEQEQTKYLVPRGSGEGAPLVLDIEAIVRAETRLEEVALVNAHNAAELLSTFNRYWLELDRNVTMLAYEKSTATHSAKRAHAEALLDVTDAKLKERGHTKASADLRAAVAILDPRVQDAEERLNQIKAVLDYLQGKRSAFENAYNSVKKLVGDRQLPLAPLNFGEKKAPENPTPQRRSWVTPDPEPVTFEETADDLDLPPGFEEPRYSR